MKTAAKVLCITALVIGLVWAAIGFIGIGMWLGGGTVRLWSGALNNFMSSIKDPYALFGLLIWSFFVVIIAGVLGIVGSDKKPAKLKPLILGGLTFICGCSLFPLSNYIAAVMYLIAGFLLLLAGLITKPNNKE